jgi:hypothetical protein
MISISDKATAILSLVPGAEVSVDDNIVTWHKPNKPAVTEEEIQAEIDRLQAEYDAQEYARNRKEEYPPMEDQLDYMYHNGFEKWKTDMIDPVKDKYPKG